jgi:hypothetical protein
MDDVLGYLRFLADTLMNMGDFADISHRVPQSR